MKLRLYAIVALMLGMMGVTAQDIHFSQFYASPLTLNPALTGNFNGLYRITGIYRNQFPGLTQNKPAFSTPSVSADFSLLKEALKNRGALGVGLVFVNDQQNGKTFNINHVLASVAYNMSFGAKKQFQLGLGFQGGIVMNKVDFAKLEFAEGYTFNGTDFVYDPSSPGHEQTNSGMSIKGAFNAGIFTNFNITEKIRYYMGYSFNNATRYKQNYIANSIDQFNIPFRHTLHGGFEFEIKDAAVLIPGYLFQSQAKATETNFGLTAGIHVKKDPNPRDRATLYIGFWNRLNKGNYTAIPKIGFEYKGFRAGFAYDYHATQKYKGYENVYKGSAASLPQGFEVTLSYIGALVIPKEDNFLFNPRY
ncbi:MAG: PorP/SprF family type IX secretion system membrane protein [Bacteroidetes bacterium]|nr:PorP/SprF family type IX secretion system membrane protein [Bacteroidota bacterium]